MDEKLVELLSKKNEQAIDEIKKQYDPKINYIVKKIVTNPSDAEECISDVYMKIWDNSDSFKREKGKFSTWICIIARNTALNYIKRKDTSFTELDKCGLTTASAEDEAERKNKAEKIMKTINLLSNEEKDLFYRKYYYLQSIAQISAEKGCTQRAIDGKLYRLRKKLQKKLGEDFV